MTAVKYDFRMI